MTCDESAAAIQALLDGALDESGKRALEAHLSACPACRQLAGDLRQIRRAARSLEPLAPPPAVWPRLADRLRAEAARTGPHRVRWTSPGWLAVAATLLVAVGAALVFLLTHGAPRVAPGPPAPAPAPAAVAASNVDPADLVSSVEAELTQAQQHYEAALSHLDRMAQAGSPAVDTRLAATLRQNVALVDQAIADSRAALQTDPQSEPARESLFEALRRKVGLLSDTIALVNEMRKGNQAGAAQIVEGIKKS